MSCKNTKILSEPEVCMIKNQRIIDFYNKNKQLDFEKVNLLYIDILENIINTSIESPSSVKLIMQSLGTQKTELNNILSVITSTSESYKNELSNIKHTYSLTTENIKNDMEGLKSMIINLSSVITTKLYETKDNYIKELKDTLKNTDAISILNIGTTIEKNNIQLVDKLMLILNDIVPKSQNKHYEDIIKIFKDDIISSLDKVKSHNPESIIEKISSIVDTKYNNLVINIQEHIMKSVSLSEDRINNNILHVKDISNKNNIIQDKINDELSIYLNKYKNSSSKGTLSENNLYNIIDKEFPSAELINTSNFTGMGDMILKRINNKPILFENKDYSNNVKKDEVDKFIRDISKNEHHGIFISQHSGIVGKEHFQIDIHNKNILIYIHNCNYDPDKIKLAVNTIDTLSIKLISVDSDNTTIPKEVIKQINDDYQHFLRQKESFLTTTKEYYKKTLDVFTQIKLPSLEKYLSNHFADSKVNKVLCTLCNKFETDNLRSLARHKQSCKKITSNIQTTLEIEQVNNTVENNTNEISSDSSDTHIESITDKSPNIVEQPSTSKKSTKPKKKINYEA
jgi:hypothetical protein